MLCHCLLLQAIVGVAMTAFFSLSGATPARESVSSDQRCCSTAGRHAAVSVSSPCRLTVCLTLLCSLSPSSLPCQIDTHSRGFDAFHYQHRLLPPATIVATPSTQSLVTAQYMEVTPDGRLLRPTRPYPTTQDEIVPLYKNRYFAEKPFTLNPQHVDGWAEDVKDWTPAYRAMLRDKYGVRGYKVRVGKLKEEEEEQEVKEEEEKKP